MSSAQSSPRPTSISTPTEHLQKAQSEAAEADYSDAVNLAEASEEYAKRRSSLAREARSGARK